MENAALRHPEPCRPAVPARVSRSRIYDRIDAESIPGYAMPPDGFEGDERKRVLNLEKHGIDFRDAIGVFDHPHLTVETIRNEEVRKVSLGKMDQCVIALVWTDRVGIIRVISARAARRDERQAYTARFGA